MIEHYMDHNQLKEFLGQKYKPIDTIRQEYPVVLNLFKNGQFPGHLLDRLRKLLERVGPSPLIVRSSSLLEDRFGASFAGKYRSVFLANQGTLEQRLAQLTGAIAEVYASIFAPDPISYRRRHDLIDYDCTESLATTFAWGQESTLRIEGEGEKRVRDTYYRPWDGPDGLREQSRTRLDRAAAKPKVVFCESAPYRFPHQPDSDCHATGNPLVTLFPRVRIPSLEGCIGIWRLRPRQPWRLWQPDGDELRLRSPRCRC